MLMSIDGGAPQDGSLCDDSQTRAGI